MNLIRAFLLSLKELPAEGGFSSTAGHSACRGLARLDTEVRI